MDDKQTDKRLRKIYGITLEEYNSMLAKQDGKCSICRKPPAARRLHVDHDHKAKKSNIFAEKHVFVAGVWYADTVYNGATLTGESRTRTGAIQQVRELLKKASVRGLLCWPCNAGLQKWRDKPVLLEAAAKYLRDFESRHKQ